MELYRVIIADDEAHIREGLSQKLDWTSLGFSLVGEAENGREALELAEQLRPDVVLTDIQMPFMTGLELCQALPSFLPASKFVVFSGFDEFDYAQQALRLQVSEYILKPIDTTELIRVLQKLKLQLDTERAERQNVEHLQHLYQESLPVLRELFLTRLLDGRTCEDRLEGEAQQHGMDLSPEHWQVGLIHLEQVTAQREMVSLSVRRLFEERLDLKDATALVFLYGEGLALLVGYPHRPDPYALMEAVNRVCRLCQSFLGVTITVGMGAPVGRQDIPLSTGGARSALDYRVLQGIGRTIYIQDIEPDSQTQLVFDDQDESNLTKAVKLGSKEEIATVVTHLMEKLESAGPVLALGQIFFLDILNCLLKLTRSVNLNLADVFGTNFTGTVQITDFTSPSTLGDWCLERCLRIQECIGRQRIDSAGRTIQRAKDFIAEHFSESELSVETLCEHLHLSPAYFSTLFKRETGMSFTAYVTEVRMETAAQLLRHSQDKTYRIAEQTGYDDPNYFSYVFKKHFGLTPTKFRAN